mmetsp:Transcript_27311/g.70342  ORF Transcript_27311/g.70342 Transcript_27311/m.70342 type:complete len:399 (+) Transcript_27311:425-1621(+)
MCWLRKGRPKWCLQGWGQGRSSQGECVGKVTRQEQGQQQQQQLLYVLLRLRMGIHCLRYTQLLPLSQQQRLRPCKASAAPPPTTATAATPALDPLISNSAGPHLSAHPLPPLPLCPRNPTCCRPRALFGSGRCSQMHQQCLSPPPMDTRSCSPPSCSCTEAAPLTRKASPWSHPTPPIHPCCHHPPHTRWPTKCPPFLPLHPPTSPSLPHSTAQWLHIWPPLPLPPFHQAPHPANLNSPPSPPSPKASPPTPRPQQRHLRNHKATTSTLLSIPTNPSITASGACSGTNPGTQLRTHIPPQSCTQRTLLQAFPILPTHTATLLPPEAPHLHEPLTSPTSATQLLPIALPYHLHHCHHRHRPNLKGSTRSSRSRTTPGATCLSCIPKRVPLIGRVRSPPP